MYRHLIGARAKIHAAMSVEHADIRELRNIALNPPEPIVEAFDTDIVEAQGAAPPIANRIASSLVIALSVVECRVRCHMREIDVDECERLRWSVIPGTIVCETIVGAELKERPRSCKLKRWSAIRRSPPPTRPHQRDIRGIDLDC